MKRASDLSRWRRRAVGQERRELRQTLDCLPLLVRVPPGRADRDVVRGIGDKERSPHRRDKVGIGPLETVYDGQSFSLTSRVRASGQPRGMTCRRILVVSLVVAPK